MYHSFVDESKNNSYLLVAALIRPAHLTRTRQLISGMVVPGQRRIHFHKERDGRRSQIIGHLAEMPIEAIIYEVRGKLHENFARSRCLTSLIRDQLARDTRRLVIESDESRVEADRRILRHENQRADAQDQVTRRIKSRTSTRGPRRASTRHS